MGIYRLKTDSVAELKCFRPRHDLTKRNPDVAYNFETQKIQDKIQGLSPLGLTYSLLPDDFGACIPAFKRLVTGLRYILLLLDSLVLFIIGKVAALLSLLDAEFDAAHIREKPKRSSGSGGQFFRLIFPKYSKLILPFPFR